AIRWIAVRITGCKEEPNVRITNERLKDVGQPGNILVLSIVVLVEHTNLLIDLRLLNLLCSCLVHDVHYNWDIGLTSAGRWSIASKTAKGLDCLPAGSVPWVCGE